MVGKHIKADGTITEVVPHDGNRFSLKELQGFVGGMIDIQVLPDGNAIYLNDNGKLEGLPINEAATKAWMKAYPIAQYPNNNDELIVGDILFLSEENEAIQNSEDEE